MAEESVILPIDIDSTGAIRSIGEFSTKASSSLGKSLNGVKGLKGLFSALPGPIGMATGALATLAVEFLLTDRTVTRANKSVKLFIDEVSKGGAQIASKPVASLELYRRSISSLELPMSQRLNALKEYNKEADKQNKLTQSDITNIEKVNQVIGNQIKLIEKRALIKGAENYIAKQYELVFQAQFQLERAADAANQKLKEQKVTVDDIKNSFKGGDQKEFGKEIFRAADAGKEIGVRNVQRLEFQVRNAKKVIQDLYEFIDRQLQSGSILGNLFDIDKAGKPDQFKKEVLDRFAEVKQIFTIDPYEWALRIDKEFLRSELAKSKEEIRKGLESYQVKIRLAPIPDKLPDAPLPLGQDVKDMALYVSDILSPAWGEYFDLMTRGEDRIKSFFKSILNSINQVIKQLAAAAVKALIFNAITGGKAGTFGSLFKSFAGISSGSVNSGSGGFGSGVVVNAIIGERNGSLYAAVQSQTNRIKKLG